MVINANAVMNLINELNKKASRMEELTSSLDESIKKYAALISSNAETKSRELLQKVNSQISEVKMLLLENQEAIMNGAKMIDKLEKEWE